MRAWAAANWRKASSFSHLRNCLQTWLNATIPLVWTKWTMPCTQWLKYKTKKWVLGVLRTTNLDLIDGWRNHGIRIFDICFVGIQEICNTESARAASNKNTGAHLMQSSSEQSMRCRRVSMLMLSYILKQASRWCKERLVWNSDRHLVGQLATNASFSAAETNCPWRNFWSRANLKKTQVTFLQHLETTNEESEDLDASMHAIRLSREIKSSLRSSSVGLEATANKI